MYASCCLWVLPLVWALSAAALALAPLTLGIVVRAPLKDGSEGCIVRRGDERRCPQRLMRLIACVHHHTKGKGMGLFSEHQPGTTD